MKSPHRNTDTGDVVDIYGNRITRDERLALIKTVSWLPATSKKDDILHAVKSHQVVIIQWETGSGKTTQIPKLLHLEYPRRQIVVMQPRVIAAQSNATRVSRELLAEMWDPQFSIGKRVGYRTGPEKSHPWTAPLSFHTDGLELMRQMIARRVPDILISDEAHGFSTASEMVSMNMREQLLKNPKLRMIITSATLDPEIFREYYRSVESSIPLIQIPWRTHPVTRTLDANDSYVDSIVSHYRNGHNILVFAPGKKEIENEIESLRTHLGPEAHIHPLHAEMSKADQDALLRKSPWDSPRIIVATNVAEESITIDYIDVVIDLASHKVARYNHRGILWLYLEDVSKASVKQRSGRAGRTHPWEYYRYSDIPYDDLPEYQDAPIGREMLDRYILMLLAEGKDLREMDRVAIERGEKLFFHGFDKKLLTISYSRLRYIGALSNKNTLTRLWHDLLHYPLDVYHARMLHESIEKGCVADMALIVAILEKKGFLSKDDIWKELGLTKSQDSDLIGYVDLLRFCIGTSITEKQKIKLINLWANPDEVADFMSRTTRKAKLYEVVDLSMLGIKQSRLKAIDDSHRDILGRLAIIGASISTSRNSRAIRTCLATGSIFHTFVYHTEDRGFSHVSDKNYADSSVFRIGDISIIEPQDGTAYIGHPFIIGGWESGMWMNLLSFLSRVDDGILKDAQISNTRYARHQFVRVWEKTKPVKVSPIKTSTNKNDNNKSPQQTKDIVKRDDGTIEYVLREASTDESQPQRGDDVSLSSGKWADIFDDGDNYMASKESLHDIEFTSDQAAADHYIRYCLPLFLLEHNEGIKKYIAWKDGAWRAIFRELLSRFLLEESHRVKLVNLEKTEHSFRYDSGILQRFEESKDHHIRYFRIHGTLPTTQEKDPDEMTEAEQLDERIFEMQAEYARLLWEATQYKALFDLSDAQKLLVQSFVWGLSQEGASGEWVEAYAYLTDAYQKLWSMEREEVASMMSSLKSIARKKDALRKLEKRKMDIQQFHHVFRQLSDKRYNSSSLRSSESEMLSKYRDFTSDEKTMVGLKKALKSALSPKKSARKRWAENMRKYTGVIVTHLANLEKERIALEQVISLYDYPIARQIGDSIDTLVRELLETKYADIRIRPKILDAVRETVRDQITENKGVDAILITLFDQSHAWGYIHGQQTHFSELVAYKDAMDVIEAHMDSVSDAVRSSEDMTYVTTMLEKLRWHLDILRKQYAILMNNPIYKVLIK
jgi:hypothetical protein